MVNRKDFHELTSDEDSDFSDADGLYASELPVNNDVAVSVARWREVDGRFARWRQRGVVLHVTVLLVDRRRTRRVLVSQTDHEVAHAPLRYNTTSALAKYGFCSAIRIS